MKRPPLPAHPRACEPKAQPSWQERAFTTAAKHLQAGLIDEARQLLILILERDPEHSDSLYLLASIAGQANDLELAEALLKQALVLERRKTPYWVLLGNVLQRRGRLEESAECYRTALTLDPACADAYYNWGNTLERQGRFEEAVACFEKAVALAPHYIQARNNLANCYRQAGRLDEAAQQLELARRQEPASVPVVLNLGNVYMAQERHSEALACFDEVLRLAPNLAVAHNNRGNVLRALDRIEEALESYDRALALEPQHADFWVNRATAYAKQGRLSEALESARQALAREPACEAAWGAALFTLHYDRTLHPAALKAEHQRWAARYADPLARLKPHRNKPDPERRLRLGYVSADFRQHPVAYFLAPVLEAHDTAQFKIFCYSNSWRADAWTERLRRKAAHWRDAAGWSDLKLAEQIEHDAIDLLVDLSGHTLGNRLLVFARRPAPIALSWLGYFNTTGMAAMDYLVVDPVIAPVGEEAPFVERPLRLERCYLCYQGPEYAPEASGPPLLKRGYVTYGCFNTLTKISPEVIAVWARILHADKDARLLLKNASLSDASTRKRIWDLFARHGVAQHRVELHGASPHAELLAAYAEIDIALDPFPYNGGTTTCEALWMGVPVITLAGDRFVSRVGQTILVNAGLSEWVARNEKEYVERALELPRDPAGLAERRISQRDRLRASALGDTRAFTRRWEHALRLVWRRWCAGA